jgi:hypothetical protein
VGKGCHSNDEREDLIDLGATAHHVPLRRARELIVKGANGVFLFRSSFFLFVLCLPLEALALLCFCSVLYLRGHSPRVHTRRRRQQTHLRMSGDKSCDKQTAQYTGKQPDEGSVVASRDTTSAENEMHSSGHTHRKSIRLKDMSAGRQAGGKQTDNKKERHIVHIPHGSLRACTLALSSTSLNKQHDFYLIASL